MKEIFIDYKSKMKELLSNKSLPITIFLVVILGYGFALANPSIGIDDTAFFRYFSGGELISQGRFVPVIFSKIFGGINFTPLWLELITLILLVVSGLLYCCLFKSITKNKISNSCYLVFIPIFISYPLINEIFIYNTALISIGIGYLLTAISTICLYEFVKRNQKKISPLFFAVFTMIACISSYESFATLFIVGLMIILFLDYLYNSNELTFGKKDWIKYIVVFIVTLICSIILEAVFTNFYISISGVEKSSAAATTISWFTKGIFNNIPLFIKSMSDSYVKLPFNYMGILIFQVITLISLLFIIIISIKKKKILVAAYFSITNFEQFFSRVCTRYSKSL